MFATPPKKPRPTAPAEPCPECFHRGGHQVNGVSDHTCDPIMAAMGIWARRRELERSAEIEEAKARARRLKKDSA